MNRQQEAATLLRTASHRDDPLLNLCEPHQNRRTVSFSRRKKRGQTNAARRRGNLSGHGHFETAWRSPARCCFARLNAGRGLPVSPPRHGLAAALLPAGSACAQTNFPERPVHLLVPCRHAHHGAGQRRDRGRERPPTPARGRARRCGGMPRVRWGRANPPPRVSVPSSS